MVNCQKGGRLLARRYKVSAGICAVQQTHGNLKYRVNRNFTHSADDMKLLRIVNTNVVSGKVWKHLTVLND